MVIRRGETAVFMCDFDLEGDSLYSVKWYKGMSEFFRFTPKDEFPIKTFPLEGLNIDVSAHKYFYNLPPPCCRLLTAV
ncbi:UNVERIFIED_CONTAM: hypothetical protein PYX00_000363 [Menopon gallinae]|uniref:MHC class II antigen n=1 Tax=Menopon gallinae TaxID=328185 RepID=A0AAW2IA92_9NEOP